MHWELKRKIVERYGSQVVFAHQIGMREARLSRLVRGYDEPKPEELEKLKEALGAAVVCCLMRTQQDSTIPAEV